LQAFFQGAAAGGKVAEPPLEGGVLGGKPPDGVGVVVALGVVELAEQLANAGALGADLGVGSLERLLGVQRPLLPGRLGLGVAVSDVLLSLTAGAGDGGADQVSGGGFVVKEGAGDPAAGGDGGVGHRESAPLHLLDGVGDGPQLVLGALASGLVGRGGPRCGGAHSAPSLAPPPLAVAARSVARNDRFHSRW